MKTLSIIFITILILFIYVCIAANKMNKKELEIYRKEAWIKGVISEIKVNENLIGCPNFDNYIERLYCRYKFNINTANAILNRWIKINVK